MNKRQVFTAILISMSLLLVNAWRVLAVPPMPSSFYGTVKVGGANVAAGTVVSAWIDGVKYGETAIQFYEGDSVYSLNVAGDDGETPEIEGGVDGDIVTFQIDDQVADQTGTWHSGTNVELNISAVGNTPPVITEGESVDVTMSEDGAPTAFSLTLHATDVNPDTLVWSVSVPAGHGDASAAGTGASIDVGYLPEANYTGSDSFVVQVSDGSGGLDSITVNVTIQAVNDPPLAVEDSYTVDMNATLNVPAGSGVLANDSDAENDPLTAVLAEDPAEGSLVFSSDGSFVYTPEADFTGLVSFTYRAYDGRSLSEEASVEIVVTGIPVTGDYQIFLPSICIDQEAPAP